MKIHISDEGDRSVGISPNEMTVDLNWDMQYEQDRKNLRKSFLDFAKDVLDFCGGRVSVVFGDECPDCLSILVDGKCINKGCISYLCPYITVFGDEHKGSCDFGGECTKWTEPNKCKIHNKNKEMSLK